MVLHDLNLAARYSDEIIALRDGAVVASGTPAEVVTSTLLREIFALDARVVTEESGIPLVIPSGGRRVRPFSPRAFPPRSRGPNAPVKRSAS